MSCEVSSTVESFDFDAEELEKLYVMLESGTIPELQWQCPGRQLPTREENTNKVEQSAAAEHAEAEPVKNDFDFSDDMAPTQMRVRNQNSMPKSVKKKMANFAGVMEVLKKKNAEGST